MPNNPIGFDYPGKRVDENIRKEDADRYSAITTTKDTDILNEVTNRLSREEVSFHTFEDRLRKELLNIKDLENNLNATKTQIKSAENMLIMREDILKKLMAERSKLRNMNIEQCKIYFDSIKNIDEELKKRIERIINELRRLILDEKAMFDMTTNDKNIIYSINQEAQKLSNDMIILARRHTSTDDILVQMYKEILMIERERQFRKSGSVNR
ncbi:MAG: hypothetical protein ACP5OA_00650 [Candidatus Woesearchaeota archaeon]